MPMIIKLRSYLTNLEENERAKGDRREVPTITALAKDVGISRVQMQRIASGNVDSLKLRVANDIIKAMRQRGFEMSVSDFLEYQD